METPIKVLKRVWMYKCHKSLKTGAILYKIDLIFYAKSKKNTRVKKSNYLIT